MVLRRMIGRGRRCLLSRRQVILGVCLLRRQLGRWGHWRMLLLMWWRRWVASIRMLISIRRILCVISVIGRVSGRLRMSVRGSRSGLQCGMRVRRLSRVGSVRILHKVLRSRLKGQQVRVVCVQRV